MSHILYEGSLLTAQGATTNLKKASKRVSHSIFVVSDLCYSLLDEWGHAGMLTPSLTNAYVDIFLASTVTLSNNYDHKCLEGESVE